MNKMYILINKDYPMSPGKVAAQTAHAVARLKDDCHPDMVVVLEATSDQLYNLEDYLYNKNVECHLYIDEGANEVPPYTITAMAVEALPEFSYWELFAGFKLYKGEKKRWLR